MIAADENLIKNVENIRTNIKNDAENIIKSLMPQKIVYLDNFFKTLNFDNPPIPIQTKHFSIELLEKIRCDPIVLNEKYHHKKRKIDESMYDQKKIHCNEKIVGVLKVLKMEILQLIEYCNSVKMWIQLNIPRIEDGNNFGVSVQEDTVSELSRAEDSGFAILESFSKYFITRGKIISKALKYPEIEDYFVSVIELDEKEFINLKLCCVDLRNNYAILYDLLTKNIEKIKKPRNNTSNSSMY